MKLGSLIDKAGLTKSNLKEALKLGVGAGAFPFLYGILQSQVGLRISPKLFAQNTPGEYAVRALSAVVLGTVAGRLTKMGAVGDGMVASGVGSVFKDLLAPMFNPAAKAAQQAVTAAEQTGQDQVSGINPLGRGLAGLGAYGRDPSMLFGVGTPDMSAQRMFNGATVAIESGGQMSGATVAIEPAGNFAAAFS